MTIQLTNKSEQITFRHTGICIESAENLDMEEVHKHVAQQQAKKEIQAPLPESITPLKNPDATSFRQN